MRVTMTDRNDGMSAVHISIFYAVLVPKRRVKSTDRLDVPKFICFEKIHFV